MGCSPSIVGHQSLKKEEGESLSIHTPEIELIKRAPNSVSKTGSNLNEISVVDQAKEKDEGSFDLPVAEFVDGNLGITAEQNLNKIEQSLKPGTLYVDFDFPPRGSSLYYRFMKDESPISWMRPHEFCDNPRLFIEGAHRKDVIQGVLANCWFLSSCSAIAQKPDLIQRVMPFDQPLKGKNYKGMIVCHFWRFGEWVTVCIDDFLPTRNKQLIYARSANPQEFWVALLEKAYAKLHGSYQALEGGQSMDAMVDFTGGLAERYDLEDSTPKVERDKLFRFLTTASKNGALIAASIKGNWQSQQKKNAKGLVEGHAYSISDVARVQTRDGKVPLICVRNPWGNDAEWTGAWADGDSAWKGVSVSQRKRLLKEDKNDGEFWMSFSDFWKEFEEISFCSSGPDFDQDGKVDQPGVVKAIRGEWILGKTAGGSRNNFQKFASNPQFLLQVLDEGALDEYINTDDYIEKKEEKSQVLIGLMQEHRHSSKDSRVKMQQIGFCVYQTTMGENRLPYTHFMYNKDDGTSGPYINFREVFCRLELTPGDYVIIPATFKPNVNGNFMLRVYSSSSIKLSAIT